MRAKSFVKRPLVVAITLALCSSGSAIAAQAEDNSANNQFSGEFVHITNGK